MQDTTTQSNTGAIGKSLLSVAGIVAVAIGLIGSSFGSAWSPQVYEFLFGFEIMKSIDSFMPYFPLVPFYPIIIMMLGAFLIIKSRT
jgi:hypothetical protein